MLMKKSNQDSSNFYLWKQTLDVSSSLTSTGPWVLPDVQPVGFISSNGLDLEGVLGFKNEKFIYFDMDVALKSIR